MSTNNFKKPQSSPVTKTPSSKRASFRKRVDEAPTWDSVPSSVVHSLICACTTSSASPTFGYTRDGSALLLAVYYRDTRYVDYLSGSDEVVEYLEWLVTELLNLSPEEQLHYLQAKLG